MPPPKICANVSTCSEEVPGVETGAECEITSVSPSSVNSIPNVATNEEMPTTAMKKPLMKPIRPAPSSARITAGTSGRPTLTLTACRRGTA